MAVDIFRRAQRLCGHTAVGMQRAGGAAGASQQALAGGVIGVHIHPAQAQIHTNARAVQAAAIDAFHLARAHHHAVIQSILIENLGKIAAGRQRAVDNLLRNFLIQHVYLLLFL